ncbi:MAG: AAA family ATPase, partial [Mycobacteriaceae bacterium]|nr:AAA family ATPase [Mycobacteriaceae bacterium]
MRGRVIAATTVCRSCGTKPRHGARFCDACGAPFAAEQAAAEYKQVTVLFADVVRSMDIADAVGPERLREIMADLVDRAAAVVERYDGRVQSFTGDGIMALFGAPVALEDHALRACRAALDIQREVQHQAAEVQDRDGLKFQLRIGLNSGQVVAGEISSGVLGYTAIGAQVGMAQRMESVAPPGGVMLSESTARLVESTAALGEPQQVRIKGKDVAVRAHMLIAITSRNEQHGRWHSRLVGRQSEMSRIAAVMGQAIAGRGCVVGVVGDPGIGKSRLVRESVALARNRNAEVFVGFCEAHSRDIAFHAVSNLLRAVCGIAEFSDVPARERVRSQFVDADEEDLRLLEDLLGIADRGAAMPDIDPDARRRRLTALVNRAQLTRSTPALYVIEDVHWIDEVSESMLTEFLSVIPQSHSMVIMTYRPEYRGALSRLAGAEQVAVVPLDLSQSTALTAQLLGSDPSVARIGQKVTERAAGNPFFAEELVRDLADRDVLTGSRGKYVGRSDIDDLGVPATLQATIAARIDRLSSQAKRTVQAAAVVGSRFTPDLLAGLDVDPAITELVEAELVDEVVSSPSPEYEFRHPLIRTVAYESQLKSSRVRLHRRLAAAIEQREATAVDATAALIAEHLEAAGDLRGAYAWHMRA